MELLHGWMNQIGKVSVSEFHRLVMSARLEDNLIILGDELVPIDLQGVLAAEVSSCFRTSVSERQETSI
jgi:hypothetical protein